MLLAELTSKWSHAAGGRHVYALRWENARIGRNGWSPAVKGGWINARKPDREYQLPLTRAMGAKAFARRFTVGPQPPRHFT
jgi:hypothetical protein